MPKRTEEAPGKPWAGGALLANVLAHNIHRLHGLRGLSHEELARRLRLAGSRWSSTTVREVERLDRRVTVDELWTLGLVLGASLHELLDPRGLGWDSPPAEPYKNLSEWVRGLVQISIIGGLDTGEPQFHVAPAPGVGWTLKEEGGTDAGQDPEAR